MFSFFNISSSMLFKSNAVEIKLERLLLYLKRIRTRTAKPPSVHLIWGQPSKPLKEKKDPCDNVTRACRLMNIRVFSGKIKTIRNLTVCKESCVRYPGSSGFCDRASEIFLNGPTSKSNFFGEIHIIYRIFFRQTVEIPYKFIWIESLFST